MSNANFRRELNDAFDDIAGSPSPALRDRVRSSIAETPEERGPYWIAAVAAALLAVVIVGVLFVFNPLNRHPVVVGPPPASPTPSATASPSPIPSPSATPTGTLPAFVCAGTAALSSSPAPLVAFIDALRTGSHAGYDRLTVEFKNGAPVSIQLQPQAGTKFLRAPSGQPITLAGQNGILVTIHGADAHTSYTGLRDIKTASYPRLVETYVLQDFEGTVQLGLGIAGPTCYRDFMLTNPARVVIDIQSS